MNDLEVLIHLLNKTKIHFAYYSAGTPEVQKQKTHYKDINQLILFKGTDWHFDMGGNLLRIK